MPANVDTLRAAIPSWGSSISHRVARGLEDPLMHANYGDYPSWVNEWTRMRGEAAHHVAQTPHERLPTAAVEPLSEEIKDINKEISKIAKVPYPNTKHIQDRLKQQIPIYETATPWLDKYATPEQNEYARLMHQHHQQVTNPIFERSLDIMRRALPGVDAQFALHGNFHGGQRHAAHRQLVERHTERAEREAAEAAGRAANEFLGHIRATKGQHLNAAELAGNLVQKERSEERQNALALQAAQDAMYKNMLLRHGAAQQGAEREHAHKQLERTAERAEQLEAREHLKDQLQWENTLAANQIHPQRNSTFFVPPTPAPANNWAMGAAMLPQAASMLGVNPQPRKKGGPIKHYAEGGNLPPMMDKYLPAMHNAEVLQMQQNATNLQNTHPNNYAQSLGLMGATMGKQLGGPLGAFSAGHEAAIRNDQAIQEARVDHQLKAANILDKIQSSRLDQQRMIMEHEKNLRNEAEQKRMHNITASHYDVQNAKLKAETDLLTGAGGRRKKSATEIKAIKEAENDLAKAIKLEHEVQTASDYNKRVSTGPIKGALAKISPALAASFGMGKTSDVQGLKRATGALFLDAHQGMKNIPRSEQFAARIDEIKGSPSNEREENEAAFREIGENAALSKEVAINTLLEMGYTPEEIDAMINKFSGVYNKEESSHDSGLKSLSNEQLMEMYRAS